MSAGGRAHCEAVGATAHRSAAETSKNAVLRRTVSELMRVSMSPCCTQ